MTPTDPTPNPSRRASLRTALTVACVIAASALALAATATTDDASGADATTPPGTGGGVPVGPVDEAAACEAATLDTGQIVGPPARKVEIDSDPVDVPTDTQVVVAPATIDVRRELQAGDSFTCVVVIRNRRDAPRTTFTLSTLGAVGTRDGGTQFVDPGDGDAATTAANWIDPVDTTIVLPERGIARVPVIVTVPPDPPVGSAYASLQVAAEPTAAVAAGDTNIGVETRVAVSFLLRVGGEGRARLTVDDPRAPRVRWDEDAWTWRGRLDNDGTLHAEPRGRLRVRSIFGSTVATMSLDSRALLPGGGVPLKTTWRGLPWLGVYRYDVDVSAANDPDGTHARDSGWIYVLPPWWVLAVVGLVAIVAIAVPVGRRRSEWRRYVDDEDEDEGDPSLDGARDRTD